MFPRDASFDALVADLFGGLRAFQAPPSTPSPSSTVRRLALATDISETDDAFVFEADLPGVKAEALEIELEGKVLTIKANRSLRPTDDTEGFRRVERADGRFERRFTLGDAVDADSIDATLEDGVLTLRMAKVADEKPRRIQVRNSAPHLAAANVDTDIETAPTTKTEEVERRQAI